MRTVQSSAGLISVWWCPSRSVVWRGGAADEGGGGEAAAHRRNLPRAHREQDRAGGEEAERLRHRVIDDLLHGAVAGRRGAEPDRRQDDAHVLHGGESEQPLVVVHLQQQECRGADRDQPEHERPAQAQALALEPLVHRFAEAGVRPERIVHTCEGHAWELVLAAATRRHLPATTVVGYENLNMSRLGLSMYPARAETGRRHPAVNGSGA